MSVDMSDFLAGFEKKTQEILNACEDTVKEESQKLMWESTAQAPVRTGFLRKSSYWTVQRSRELIRGIVGFTAPYSIFVHEGLGRGKRQAAKFLENPFKARSQVFLKAIANKLKRLL